MMEPELQSKKLLCCSVRRDGVEGTRWNWRSQREAIMDDRGEVAKRVNR